MRRHESLVIIIMGMARSSNATNAQRCQIHYLYKYHECLDVSQIKIDWPSRKSLGIRTKIGTLATKENLYT
jgi:hypothetical protein